MSSKDTFDPSQPICRADEQTPDSIADRTGKGTSRDKPFINSFLEHLVRTKIVSEDIAVQASTWRNESKDRWKKSLIDVLVDDFDVSREVLYDEVAKFYSFRIIDFHDRNTKRFAPSQVNKLLGDLPEPIYRLATKHKVIPRATRRTEILFRIDGQLNSWYTIEDARAEAVVAVVKGRGMNLDRFERMAAQDGAAQKIVTGVTRHHH